MVSWPFKLDARVRFLLKRQASNDRRNIRPRWLWAFDLEDSPVDGVHLETPMEQRVYREPVGAHLYNDMALKDEAKKEGVEHPTDLTITVSTAECHRLAQALAPWWEEDLYLPGPLDILQFDDDLYELQDYAQPHKYWGTSNVVTVWVVPAIKMPLLSVDLGAPFDLNEEPPLLEFPELLGGTKAEN